MKKVIFNFSALLFCCVLVFISCKKTDSKADDASIQEQNADDDARVQTESNSAADDANAALGGDSYVSGGRIAAFTNPFNRPYLVHGADTVLIDTVKRIVRIHYNDTVLVNGRYRSGCIIIQLTAKTQWQDTNAVITIKFDNYSSTRKNGGKTIIINGSKTITNLTGGLVSMLSSSGYAYTSISHQIQTTGSGLSITFDNGKTAIWNTNRTRKISYVGTVTIGAIAIQEYRYTLSGNYNTPSNSNIAWWGITRNNEEFFAAIPSPIIFDQSIDWLGPISGELDVTGTARPFDILYGVNSSGSTGSTGVPYGYKISWTDLNGKARTVVLPYL